MGQMPNTVEIASETGLIAALSAIGISLGEVADDTRCSIYFLVAPGGGVLYVGTSRSLRKERRPRNERNWISRHDLSEGSVGLARLGARHAATHRMYELTRVDAVTLRTVAEKKLRDDVLKRLLDELGDDLAIEQAIDVACVERTLVRLIVQAGFLVGNSQYASQWEGHLGTLADELAYLAMWNSRTLDHDLTRGFAAQSGPNPTTAESHPFLTSRTDQRMEAPPA